MPPRTFVPLTDPSLEPCPPDAVLIEYGRRAVLDERRTFDGVFDEALRLVQQREFYSMTELAAHFGHEPHWATRFKEAVLRQGLMSLEDFARCFTRRRDGRGRPPCGLDGLSIKEQQPPTAEQTRRRTAEDGNDQYQQHHDSGNGESLCGGHEDIPECSGSHSSST